ncbi:2,5-didehydrogluconate reductase DkgA [Rouxiella badensis]|jgi:2,5-diketo-D-gluconate reductase A|uniref:2,5-didehydrogluconate reductase A n=1 Tax=Rouxiella badensis TaxID=1646377 RepID=A0A1X0WB47_9GAMM|nr:2,5-didehydrogluconate reductase DkgA [Rouxiella badensis]MCC3704214.1 2,5-didehydrogluconate reductase DkgA [Rouxiella badensis]ORJ24010.1 2,5-didehydrogluconate reductase A [Rouxiella badensis]QII36422.1 2,5-didehydrogluconate reductase DkgA [Rouxiella badensis]QOI56536.1 2,5-didehydrogluconate reductase DkgA [Rouxiella badensis subsp. acadiensis]WAT05979.1 2,5-didehydrogluconate reductase DkgA [Rouxiella badensis]
MSTQSIIKLNDGNRIPQLGLGVWKASNDEATHAVATALDAGYRHIDTAAAYKNEVGVGRALAETSIPREEIFVTTKLWNDQQLYAQKALEESLDKLKLDYIDLYLIHWPLPDQDNYVESWKQLLKLKEQGLAKSVGVCNFHIPHLQRLIDETGTAPTVNQIELHPSLPQRQLHAWNATHRIATESWSPLAQGGDGLFEEALIQKLAKKYGKTPAQIVIRWHLDNGLIVIPKSVTPKRIHENFNVFDFKLEKEELSEFTKLDTGKRLGPNPEHKLNF